MLIKYIISIFITFMMICVLMGFLMLNSVNKSVVIEGLTVPCVGVTDPQNPAFRYKLDTWNTILGIVFVETIFMPVIVANNYLFCPVSYK